MEIDSFINNAAKTITTQHSFYESLANKLLPVKEFPSVIEGENIVSKVSKTSLSCSISGVDSGFVSKKLSFFDIVLIRTAGVVFFFDKGVLSKTEYYPSPVSFPIPLPLKSGLEKDEENQSVSLERLKQEVSLSIQIIEKYKPKFAFIDGSIVPQYQDKPRGDSVLNDDYQGIIFLFEKLYSVAQKNNCTIISCVEDSRGTRFKQILLEVLQKNSLISPKDIDSCFDISLLDYLLLEGERTFPFAYTKDVLMHAILKDYSSAWAKSVFVFYLKASSFDRPLRIEFICKDCEIENISKKASEIASVVYTLSSLHKEYSYPSVLIEADLRAKLNEQDISLVYDRLSDKLGPKINMRRNNRPFG